MLAELKVSNFILIESLQLQLKQGLTTITGETGAGKSILLGALKLILGDRADLQQMKNQSEKCVIEAIFSEINTPVLNRVLESNDLDVLPELIIRREILPSGSSRAFVNDTPTKLEVLKSLSPLLIDIHSQFNTSELLESNYQMRILDIVAKNEQLLKAYENSFKLWKSFEKRIREKEQKRDEEKKEYDYNNFLLKELEDLKIENLDEEKELKNELDLQENAEKILELLNETNQINSDEHYGVSSLLHQLLLKVQSLASLLPSQENLAKRMNSVKLEFDDIMLELQAQSDDLGLEPEKLELLRERLNEIYRLQQKHKAGSISELIDKREEFSNKTENLETLESEIEELKNEFVTLEKELEKRAEKLHQNREAVLEVSEKNLMKSLSLLGMEKARIQFSLQATNHLNSSGKDDVQILFSANPGMLPTPLQKGSSGGERSRLMFAIKKMIAHHQSLPTLVFDEIDTGVSGKIADEMGVLMQEMGLKNQLLVITHLPQIAAKGGQHFKVFKSNEEERTYTKMLSLSSEEREQEIAAMLSGAEVSSSALEQAKKLLSIPR